MKEDIYLPLPVLPEIYGRKTSISLCQSCQKSMEGRHLSPFASPPRNLWKEDIYFPLPILPEIYEGRHLSPFASPARNLWKEDIHLPLPVSSQPSIVEYEQKMAQMLFWPTWKDGKSQQKVVIFFSIHEVRISMIHTARF